MTVDIVEIKPAISKMEKEIEHSVYKLVNNRHSVGIL